MTRPDDIPTAPIKDGTSLPGEVRLWWYLHVLAACGDRGTFCCDDPGEWVAAFCDDDQPIDTFNRAIEMKLAGWSHDSDSDVSKTWITEAGKAWLADRATLSSLEAEESGDADLI